MHTGHPSLHRKERDMKKLVFAITLLAFISDAFPVTLSYIDFFVKDNDDYQYITKKLSIEAEPYCEWQPEWQHDISKDSVIRILVKGVKSVDSIAHQKQTYKSLLMKGLLFFYLYQLDYDSSYTHALECFQKANKLAPDSLEPKWFEAMHYVYSAKQEVGIPVFLTLGQKNVKNPSFWDDYAKCMVLSLMPAHGAFGLEQAKLMGGNGSYNYDYKVCDLLRTKIKPSNIDSIYDLERLWSRAEFNNEFQYKSYFFGVFFKTKIDWDASAPPYQPKTKTGFISFQLTNIGKVHDTITSHLLLKMEFLNDSSSQDALIENMIKDSKSDSVVPFCSFAKYNARAFHMYSSTQYQFGGGAYTSVISFVRRPPQNPGLQLETFHSFPAEGKKFYSLEGYLSRPKKWIRYTIIFDSCKKIEKTTNTMLEYFENNFKVD